MVKLIKKSIYLLIVILFIFFGGRYYINFIVGISSFFLDMSHPKYELYVCDKKNKIVCKVKKNEKIYDKKGNFITCKDICGTLSLKSLLINPIIFLVLLMFYPQRSKTKFITLIIALPMLIGSEIIFTIFNMTFLFEQKIGLIFKSQHEKVFTMFFLNNGGRQFIALIIFTISVTVYKNRYKEETL